MQKKLSKIIDSKAFEMSRANALSVLGRMSWGTHFFVYPSVLGLYVGVYKPY